MREENQEKRQAEALELARLLRATSRTFSLGIERLRRPLRDQVRVAYLVLRVSDYVEDNRVMSPEEKGRVLRLWHEVLHDEAPADRFAEALKQQRGHDPIPDLEAARHAPRIVEELRSLEPRARAAVAGHAGRSTLGMARWAERGPRFDDESDLDDYMHEVAGRVGYLLTDLFALASPGIRRRHEELTALGREFGLALQTVNVIRGMSTDRHRGWIFLPRSFLPADTAPAKIFKPEHRGEAMRAMASLVAKAERHFAGARKYVTLLPRTQHRIRVFCELPLFFGLATLAVSAGNPRVLTGKVKISKDEVRAIVRSTRAFGASNRWVRWYARRLTSRGRDDARSADGRASDAQ